MKANDSHPVAEAGRGNLDTASDRIRTYDPRFTNSEPDVPPCTSA